MSPYWADICAFIVRKKTAHAMGFECHGARLVVTEHMLLATPFCGQQYVSIWEGWLS